MGIQHFLILQMLILDSQQLLIVLKKRHIPLIPTQYRINQIKDLIKCFSPGNLNILQMFIITLFHIIDKLIKVIDNIAQVDFSEFDVIFEELQCLMLGLDRYCVELFGGGVSSGHEEVAVEVVVAAEVLVEGVGGLCVDGVAVFYLFVQLQ